MRLLQMVMLLTLSLSIVDSMSIAGNACEDTMIENLCSDGERTLPDGTMKFRGGCGCSGIKEGEQCDDPDFGHIRCRKTCGHCSSGSREKCPSLLEDIRDCPSLFEDIHGSCFFISSDHSGVKATWEEARGLCQDLGALLGHDIDLAELDSQEGSIYPYDLALMRALSSKEDDYWLGATDQFDVGTWVWAHTKEVFSKSSSMWWHESPDNLGNSEHCLIARSFRDYHNRIYLDDLTCNRSLHYVCQVFYCDPFSQEGRKWRP